MLDVHAPHKAIHGTGEFFLHLFTITVGLLIAVGIEGAVTRHEHHKLAEEARETMAAEIRHNQGSVRDAIKAVAEHQTRLKANLATVTAVQANPNGPEAENAHLDISYNTVGLEHTAWRTAQATGALAYMSYDDAQRFSSIYEVAETFEKSEDQLAGDEARFLGLIRRYLPKDKRLSKEGADALAEQFGVLQGHLLAIDIAARVLQEQQNAFLEGRKPSNHMSESISE